MTDTMLDILRTRAQNICEKSIQLIHEFSGMQPVNNPGNSVVLISVSGDHFWKSLPPGGKQIQAKLLPEFDRFGHIVRVLIRNLPGGVQADLDESLKIMRSYIEQEGSTWSKTPGEAIEKVRSLIKEIIANLENYFDRSSEEALAIVDTNALLQNPDIENWQFEDMDHFTIILTPLVLSELDRHKVNHTKQQVREKALTIIRKIKEYRRRGSLHEGVVVVKKKVALRSIAIEPDMAQNLSWLDATNADDRFLATAVEIMRDNLGTMTFIVTADINMQNKAEFAGIPFREVPVSTVEQGEQ